MSVRPRRAVFLDRDGVLVRAFARDGRPYPAARLEELEVLPGVAEACAALRDAGFLLVVVTNQPDVARGTQTLETIERMHELMREAVAVDEVLVCPHDDADRCACRKPLPGMITGAAERLGIDLGRSFLVGDRWRDVDAGRAAGCTTVFVDRCYDEPLREQPDLVVSDLGEAAAWILAVSDAKDVR